MVKTPILDFLDGVGVFVLGGDPSFLAETLGGLKEGPGLGAPGALFLATNCNPPCGWICWEPGPSRSVTLTRTW